MTKSLLHLISTLEGGGAERQLAMLAAEQAARGWEVHIGLRRSQGVYADLIRNGRVEIHQLGDYRYIDPRLCLRISALIRELKPDVVQTWLPQMDLQGGVAANWHSVPWVLSERTARLAFESFDLLTWLRKQVGRHAQAVVANSSTGESYWKDILPNTTTLKKISNAVDVEAVRGMAPVSSEFTQKNQKIILIVGRLIATKAVDIVLQAISLLNERENIRFIIMGEGPLRQELEALIKTLQIVDSVSMLPFQKSWWGWLKTADALVSMSQYEGNPNVVLEAMAAGCPLIVSDISAHREVLSDSSACFVTCGNSIELAAAFKKLLADPDTARKKAEHAKAFAEGLTIQRAANAYEEVYASVRRRRGAL